MVTTREIFERNQRVAGRSEEVKKVLENRYITEQTEFYKRQADPIKQNNIASLKNFIEQSKKAVEEYREKIKDLRDRMARTRVDKDREKYDEYIDEYEDRINAKQRAISIAEEELQKYENLDWEDVLGYGEDYGSKIISYARDVEYYERERSEAARQRQKWLRELKQSPDWANIKKLTGLDNSASYYDVIQKLKELQQPGWYDVTTGKFQQWYDPTTKPKFLEGNKNIVYLREGLANPKEANELIQKINERSNIIEQTTKAKEQGVTYLPKEAFENIPKESNIRILAHATTELEKSPAEMVLLDEWKKKIDNETIKKAEQIANTTTLEQLRNITQYNIKDFLKLRGGVEESREVLTTAYSLKISEQIQKEVEQRISPKIETINAKYQTELNNLANDYSLDNETFKKRYYETLDNYYKEINNVKVEAENLSSEIAKGRQIELEDYARKLNIKTYINLPSIALVAATSAVLNVAGGTAIAGGTVFGRAALGTLAVAGTATLGYSLYQDINEIYSLYKNNNLNLERASLILLPTVTFLGAAIAGGYAGGKLIQPKLATLSKEATLNLYGSKGLQGQLINNKPLQNQIFTPKNMQRGYAEINYRGWRVRVPASESLYRKVKLYEAVFNEGTTIKTKYVGLSDELKLRIFTDLKNSISEDILLNRNSIYKINTKELTKATGKTISERDLYGVSGVVNGREFDIYFKYNKNVGVKPEYIVYKQPIAENSRVILARIGKISGIKTTEKPDLFLGKIKIESLNIKPVNDILVFAKPGKSTILFQDEQLVVSLRNYQILLKEIIGATGKQEVNYWQFLEGVKFLKKPYKNRGEVFEGKVSSLSFEKTTPAKFKIGEDLFVKDLTKLKVREKSIFGGDFKNLEKPEFFDFKITKETPKLKDTLRSIYKSDLEKGKQQLTKIDQKLSLEKDFLSLSKELKIVPKLQKTELKPITTPKVKTETKNIFMPLGKMPEQKTKQEIKQNQLSEKRTVAPEIKQRSLFNDLNKIKLWEEPMTKMQRQLSNTKQRTFTNQITQQQNTFDFAMKPFLKTNIKTTIKPITIKPMKLKFPIKNIEPTPKKVKKAGLTKNKNKGYIAEIRRGGKWLRVSDAFEDFESAFAIGKMKTKQTLGASFRVREIKETPKGSLGVGINSNDNEFYKKMEETPVYIQKKEKRLGTRSEIKEIQQARKSAENYWLR